jgi:hypothetical protein
MSKTCAVFISGASIKLSQKKRTSSVPLAVSSIRHWNVNKPRGITHRLVRIHYTLTMTSVLFPCAVAQTQAHKVGLALNLSTGVAFSGVSIFYGTEAEGRWFRILAASRW